MKKYMRLKRSCIFIFCFLLNFIFIIQNVNAENAEVMLKGNALKAGDCIGIAAPASGIEDMNITAAIVKLESWGYQVKLAPNLMAQSGYLAGSDEQRASDLNAMFADYEVKAILCLRGGYGSNRILDMLDYEMIKQHPKMLIGYSDITALHAALQQKCNLATIHAAMAIDINDYAPNYTDEQLKHGLVNVNVSNSGEFILPQGYSLEVLNEGRAEGVLIGGNLSVIASLCGTPYELKGDNAILFIEEVGEDSYVIDRMLWQLWENGLLQKVNGIIIGNLRRCEPVEPLPYDYSVKQVFEHYAKLANVPVLYNIPIGHGSINGFLPLGVKAVIEANRTQPRLIIQENYAK